MKKISLIIGLLFSIMILNPSQSYSQDWPQWRGINRDSKVTGFKTPVTWPAELKQEWKVVVGFGDAIRKSFYVLMLLQERNYGKPSILRVQLLVQLVLTPDPEVLRPFPVAKSLHLEQLQYSHVLTLKMVR